MRHHRARPTSHLAYLPEFLSVIWANRWPVGALLLLLAGQAALEPSAAWITKDLVEAIRAAHLTAMQVVTEFGALFLAIMAGLTVLEFAQKVVSKAVEVRLIIALQRVYLERRQREHIARDVSQIFYGCELAKKGLEVLYKDAWKILATTVSVLVWQMNLGAEWLPLMILSVLPALLLVWAFGRPIQGVSQGILDLQAELAANTGRAANLLFARHQESWFRKALRLEVLKWCADEAVDAVMWLILALLVALSYLFDLGLLPKDIELGAAAAFLINVKLLAKPLGDIGKLYTKWREAYPAAVRVFSPY